MVRIFTSCQRLACRVGMLLLLLGIFIPSILPGSAVAQPETAPRASTPDEPVQPEVRSVLAQYGRFIQHARY